MKNGLVIGAFSLLSVVAALGWTRKPSPQPVDMASQPYSAQPGGYAAGPQLINASNSAPGVYPCVSPAYQPAYQSVAPAPRRAVRRVYADRGYTTTSYVKPRSTKRSVAIVAGSSGLGAAIGALAGGGRGAAIGALAGGGGGFIYDRLTHKNPKLF
jgi:hypothetical protein